MATVFFDAALDDQWRRERLYAGDLFVYSATPETRAFCAFAQEMIEHAFEGDPETAQERMTVPDYIAVLEDLKPRFIHDPESKRHIQASLAALGCDLDSTYFDVPRMRSSTSDGYLTTGIAYAWHPHRDTWYSAPPAQLNWWLPIFPLAADNTVAFHPRYFDQAVENDSSGYNYYEWNRKYRAAASAQVGKDTRPLPRPTQEVELESTVRLVCPVGGAIIFSGAQLHSSVPNTAGKTRFSIDFRTVNVEDVRAGLGAPTQDVHCTGSSIRDFKRCRDFADCPESVVELFRDGTEGSGDLSFEAAERSQVRSG